MRLDTVFNYCSLELNYNYAVLLKAIMANHQNVDPVLHCLSVVIPFYNSYENMYPAFTNKFSFGDLSQNRHR